MSSTRTLRQAAAALLPLMLLGCGGGDDGDPSGRLDLAVTDAPVDGATEVVVEFTGVELQRSGGGERLQFDFAAPRQIDLLALTGTDSTLLLDDALVPAGQYEFIRLKVNSSRTEPDSFIRLDDGSVHPLFIPSGAESGLKLNGAFVIGAGSTSDFTVDFDLRKSVHEPQNAQDAYFLRPTLRVVNNLVVGSIGGTVTAALATAAGCSPAVYVFPGTAVAPDDVDGADPEPLDSALVELNTTSGNYEYVVGFLPAGPYTVAYTCDAAADDPEADDTLTFVAHDATVSAGAQATVNFP